MWMGWPRLLPPVLPLSLLIPALPCPALASLQVMVRVGMLDKYHAFAAAVKAGQPWAPSTTGSDANGASGQSSMRDGKQAATDIEANGAAAAS